MSKCSKCGEEIDISEFADAIRLGNYVDFVYWADVSGQCWSCYREVEFDETPLIESSIPAPGTALTLRQKYGQRNTDGG